MCSSSAPESQSETENPGQSTVPDAVCEAYQRLLQCIAGPASSRVPRRRKSPARLTALVGVRGSYPLGVVKPGKNGEAAEETLGEVIAAEQMVEDDVTEAILLRQVVREVRGFVASLPPSERQAVILVYWKGKTQAEAARHLGVTEAAVSRALSRAYARGRVALAEVWATATAA